MSVLANARRYLTVSANQLINSVLRMICYGRIHFIEPWATLNCFIVPLMPQRAIRNLNLAGGGC